MKPYLFLIIILTTALLRADEVRLTKDFLDVSGISLSAKGGKPVTLVTDERRGPGGAGMALYKVSTDSAGDGGSMSWPVKGLALKGEATVSLFVLPQGRPLKKVNLEFLSGGKPLASVSRSDIPAGAWQQISEKITIPEPITIASKFDSRPSIFFALNPSSSPSISFCGPDASFIIGFTTMK
jgi:hypothetical protein